MKNLNPLYEYKKITPEMLRKMKRLHIDYYGGKQASRAARANLEKRMKENPGLREVYEELCKSWK